MTTDQILEEIKALLQEKQTDYGTEDDPLAASRAAESFGLPGWLGQLIRIQEKMLRLQAAGQQVALGCTPDSDLIDEQLRDIAGLAIVALVNLRGSNHAVPQDEWISCSFCGDRFQKGRSGSISSGKGIWCSSTCHYHWERQVS